MCEYYVQVNCYKHGDGAELWGCIWQVYHSQNLYSSNSSYHKHDDDDDDDDDVYVTYL
jgi:hypothetical protein